MHTDATGHYTDVYTWNTGPNTDAHMDRGGQNVDVYTGAATKQHTDVYADNTDYINGYPRTESVYNNKCKFKN